MSGDLPRAAIVLSGNELLDGRTRDTNGVFASAQLSARGVKVTSVLTVADDAERLTAAFRYSLEGEPDLLVVGGGLGTTHDDLTAACLAETLGVGLREDPQALAWVEEKVRLVARRRHQLFEDVFPVARRQARLPEGATPVPPAGVAPGIAARRGPTRIFAFPGVPWEFESMWNAVAADLQAQGLFPDVAVRVVRIFGVGELQVGPVLDALPHDLLEAGINVGGGEVTVRLRYRRSHSAAGARPMPWSPLSRRPCPSSAPTAAQSTTSSPTACVRPAPRWPSPNRAQAVCSAPASRNAPVRPTTSSAGCSATPTR